tara:strand:- start:1497 stop:1973 length:477 start_codon:yes stop_codon:yes gene_type:complete
MASAISEWTTIGVNSGNPSAQGLNVPIVPGTNGQVRHECLMWLDGTDAVYTKPFDFPITGDFTIILNGTLNQLDDDAGNIDVDIEGSIDGVNYIKLDDLIATWDAGGGSETETVAVAIYDYDGKGRMPYMRLSLNPSADADCVAADENIKITIILHSL